MNQQVTEHINALNSKPKQAWQAEVCNQIRQIINQSIPEVEERLQYGKPHFLKNGKYACVLGTAKDWVSFTIFNAQTLETPEGLFETSDNGDRKTIKIREGQAIDYELLTQLVQQAANSR
jgi:hypothetical protein